MSTKDDLQQLAMLLHGGIGSSDDPLVIDQLENMLQSIAYVLANRYPDSTSRGGGGDGGATKSSADSSSRPQKVKKFVRFSDVVEAITEDNLGTGIGVMLPRVIEVCVHARLDLMVLRKDLDVARIRREILSAPKNGVINLANLRIKPQDWKHDFSLLTCLGRSNKGDERMSQNQVGRLKAIFHVLSSCRHPLSVPWNIDEKVDEALTYDGDGSKYFKELDEEFHRLLREPRRVVPRVKTKTVLKAMRFLLHTLRLHQSYIKKGETVRLLRVNDSNDETLWSEGKITGDIRYETYSGGLRRDVQCGGSFEVTLDGTNEKCRVRNGDALQVRVDDSASSSAPTYVHGRVEHVFYETRDSSCGALCIRCRPVHRVRWRGEKHSVHRDQVDRTFQVTDKLRGTRVKIQTFDLREVKEFRGTTRDKVSLKICGAPSKLIKSHALKAGDVVNVRLKGENSWRQNVKLSADANPKNGHFAICGDDGSSIDVPRESFVILSQKPGQPMYKVRTNCLERRDDKTKYPLNRISSVKGPIVLDIYHDHWGYSTSHSNRRRKKEFSKAQRQLKGILKKIQRETKRFRMPGSPSSADRGKWAEDLSNLFRYVERLIGHVDEKSTRRVTQVCRQCAESIIYCWAALYDVGDDLRERILTTKMALKGRLLPFLYRQGIGITRETAVKLAFVFCRGTAGYHLLANKKQAEGKDQRFWNLHDTTLLVQTLTDELIRLYETIVRVQLERAKGLRRNVTRVKVVVLDDDDGPKELMGTFVRSTLDYDKEDIDDFDYFSMDEEDDDDECSSSSCCSTKDSTSWKFEVLLDRDVDSVDVLSADSDKARTSGDPSILGVRRATVVREESHTVEIEYNDNDTNDDNDTNETAKLICTPGYLMRRGVGKEDCYFDERGNVLLCTMSGKRGTLVIDKGTGTSPRTATVKSITVSSPLSVKYCDNDEEEEIQNAWKIEMPVKQVITVVDKVEITKTRPL